MSFTFTDTDGQKYRVSVRAAYAKTITCSRKLYAAKDQCVRNRRVSGYVAWANATQQKTIQQWANDRELFTKSERIDKMYRVVCWNTGEVISTHEKLRNAKRACRKLGALSTTKDWENEYLKTLAPIAYVKDRHGFCVYNPRFKNLNYTGG